MLEIGTKQVFKYIYFILVENKPKTTVWNIVNNSSNIVIGVIEWYGPWRQYIVQFNSDAVFNDGCLEDIKSRISNLNRIQKERVILDKSPG